jgi:hypothetical protein
MIKAIPVTGHEGPESCQTSRLPNFQTIGSQMAVKLLALRAGRPLTPRRFLVLISARGSVDPRGRIRSIEKPNDLTENRTRGLLACSTVPQPTTLPRAPIKL